MKGIVQKLLLTAFKGLATLTSNKGEQGKLLILIYHRVLDGPDFMRPSEVDRTQFDWQMELVAHHFNPLSLEEALELMAQGELPPRAVCITFDDGYADNLTHAIPILKKYNLSATFFIATGFLDGGRMWNDTVIEAVRNSEGDRLDLTELGLESYDISSQTAKKESAESILTTIKHLPPKERLNKAEQIGKQATSLPQNLMLTTQQLKELAQSGMEIGGHTVTHPILSTLNSAQAHEEISEGKAFLERSLKQPISYFAYPNGKRGQDYLPEQLKIVEECGFKGAVTTEWGVNSKNSDFFELARFTPWDKTAEKFMLRMALSYRD